MGFLGFLGGPLGWVMDLIYQVVNSYGLVDCVVYCAGKSSNAAFHH